MSDWPNNGCPPPPGTAGGAGAPGSSSGERGIVPLGPGGGRRKALTLPSGLFFCVLGGAVASSTLSLLGPVFVGYGLVSASEAAGLRGKLLCLPASLVPAVALSLSGGVAVVVTTVICCLAALLVAELTLRGKVTPGVGCLAVAALALVHLGADTLVAASQGTSVYASVEAVLDAYDAQLSGAGVTAVAVMQQVRSLMSTFWPMAYVVTALGEFLFAGMGVSLAAPRMAERTVRPQRVSEFDLPLWVVAVLVAAAAVLALGLSLTGAVADVSVMVSANVIMSLRFAFAIQGLAVLAWFLGRHRVGPVASALLGGAALYLEVQFVVLTIAGLVDVWANFRHLDRGGRPGVGAAAKQENGSAQAD